MQKQHAQQYAWTSGARAGEGVKQRLSTQIEGDANVGHRHRLWLLHALLDASHRSVGDSTLALRNAQPAKRPSHQMPCGRT